MIKILTIVVARPQFIKAAMISRAVAEHNRRSANPIIVEETFMPASITVQT